MDKQNIFIFGHINKWSDVTYYNIDEPWKHAKWKKIVIKDHILCDSINMKCSEQKSIKTESWFTVA